jgi:small subunit ribosomal protein S17
MSDDEQTKEPQEETVPAEGAEAPAADSAAEEAPAAEAAAEEAAEAPKAEDAEEPAAEEAPKAEDAEKPAAEEAPAAEEPNPEDELPWKERRRLERSRLPHEPKPQRDSEARAAERREARGAKATLRRSQRAAERAKKGETGAGTPVAERAANPAKVRRGVVVSDRGEKSITVRIDIVRRHPTYEKVVRSSRTLHAHDERNEASEGDVVQVVETRPLSKTKRWRLVEVLERAK